MLSKPQLFERLAGGLAAGVTVLTPNRRLAQSLILEFDSFQLNKNLTAWDAADILPLDAFVQRLYEEALYTDLGTELPPLLSGMQEQALWEEALAGADLLVVPHAAAQARDAWGLAHQWRIGAGPGNEDAAAFSRWKRTYEKKTQGDVDSARLPDLIAGLLGKLKLPKVVVLYAFGVVPPQAKDLLAALQGQGVEVVAVFPERKESFSSKTSFPSAREELEAAASWARTRLEEGRKRIGVVVPDLQARRKEVVRVFARVMGSRQPFNVSLGMPLSQYPLVAAALLILKFSSNEITFEEASRLVRSPFIGGAESGMAARARLDARLREDAPPRLGLAKLIGLTDGAFRSLLEKVFALKSEKASSPHEWARHFTRILEAAGFPGERAPDSDEFQARAKFEEALSEFARLAVVSPKMGFPAAISHLAYQCENTLFQPESPDAPVQVLGVLESQGLEFDALWVSGMTDDTWPPRARPNPFLSIPLQRAAGIPQASAEGSLLFAKSVTEGWQSAAGEVVFSWPAMEEDRALIGSPLLSKIKLEMVKGKAYPRHRDAIFAARRLESIPDGQAPALATSKPRGGTRILADQAACPFRAFARHRLGAEALGEAVPGPDAMDRGQMLHTLMKELWEQLKNNLALNKENSLVIEGAAAAAVKEAGLEEPLAGMERKRLARLARDWLDIEKDRPAFSIKKLEAEVQLQAGPLTLRGRIDRMDELASGGHAVIDYKAGSPTPNKWMGSRPEEPQLPLYALSSEEPITAVAFAKLKTGQMRYMGFSREKNAIPQVKQAENWETLLDGWKQETDALGKGFAAGEARVDPKDGLATCRYCDLQTLCRVYERVNALDDEGGEAE
jgi:probable DNA repair protein